MIFFKDPETIKLAQTITVRAAMNTIDEGEDRDDDRLPVILFFFKVDSEKRETILMITNCA